MAVFTLTFIRHGETLANKERRIQGQRDTALSAEGEKQATFCGLYLQNERFTHVYSSDLTRAYKTCEIILSKNQKTNCEISKDVRLRERKFGVFEGKGRSEFISAAKKAKKKFGDFIPEGAENTSQVRVRAVDFFDDLCQQMRALIENDNSMYVPLPIKRRRVTGNSCSDVFPFPENPSDTSSGITIECKGSSDSHSPTTKEAKPKRYGSTSSSGCSSLASTEQLGDHSADHHFSDTDLPSCSENRITLTDAMLTPAQDVEIEASVKAPKAASIYTCPNVSLSPLFGHRLPSMSSISSGRNSFDDGEMTPLVIADVLLVSHGGLLKELTSHFMSNLDCRIAGGKRLAYQISPNTGISKFTITLTDDGPPRVTCLLFHNKEHLNEANCDALEYSGDV